MKTILIYTAVFTAFQNDLRLQYTQTTRMSHDHSWQVQP